MKIRIFDAPLLQPVFECFKGLYTRWLCGGQAFKQHYAPRPLIRDRRSASDQEHQSGINKSYERTKHSTRTVVSHTVASPSSPRAEPDN